MKRAVRASWRCAANIRIFNGTWSGGLISPGVGGSSSSVGALTRHRRDVTPEGACSTLIDVQEQQAASESAVSVEPEPKHGLARDVTLYSLARLGMLAVVAAVLVLLNVPLLVAAAVAVVVAMPLSLLVFGRLHRRVSEGMARRSEQRRARREELKAQLRGEREEEAAEDSEEPR